MANTAKRKPLPTIGVDKYTFFAVLTDTSEGATYGDPYNLRGTVEIAPTDAGGSDVFDADNGAYETSNYIEKLGHDITNADIPPEVDSMWRGLTPYTAVQRDFDNNYYAYFDESDLPEGVTKTELEENWFKDMNYYPVKKAL